MEEFHCTYFGAFQYLLDQRLLFTMFRTFPTSSIKVISEKNILESFKNGKCIKINLKT